MSVKVENEDEEEEEREDGELVQPQSEEEDEGDDSVLTVVDEGVSNNSLAREAAASVGVTRTRDTRGEKTTNQTGKKRTGGAQTGEPVKKKTTSESWVW